MTIYDLFFYFAIYSVIGWMIEVSYHAIKQGVVVNRGFLNGPLCPIYGTGMIIIFMVLYGVGAVIGKNTDVNHASVVLLFFVGLCFCTLVELITGFVMDKMFHTRWWDYSNEKFNFKGYICLSFSILWGLGAALVLKVLCPMVDKLERFIPRKIGIAFLIIYFIIFIVDEVISIMSVLKFTRQLEKMRDIQNAIHKLSDGMSEIVGGGTIKTMEKVEEGKEFADKAKNEIKETAGDIKEAYDAKMDEYEERIKEMYSILRKQRFFGIGRFAKAFPDMKSIRYKEPLDKLRAYVKTQREENKKEKETSKTKENNK